MDEKFGNVRLTEWLQVWVKDSMELRFECLYRLQRERMRRVGQENGTARDKLSFPVPVSRVVEGKRRLYTTISQEALRPVRPGKRTLDLRTEQYDSPSDFCPYSAPAFQLFSSLKVAEVFRGYIERRHPLSPGSGSWGQYF
jgi:hypothetical protein